MALLRYTLLRLLVFGVLAALLWLVGMRGWAWIFVAVLASGIVSLVVLRGSRDKVSAALDRRLSTARQRLAERTEAEDAWDDAHRGGHDSTTDGPGAASPE